MHQETGAAMNYYEHMCEGISHTIRPGDTLYRLSRLYGVPLEKIMDANPDVNIYHLDIGSIVCIPMAPAPPNVRVYPSGAGTDWTMVMPYTVRTGESIGHILKTFHMDFDTFASMNPKLMPRPPKAGETVYVRCRREILNEGAQKETNGAKES